MGVAVTALLTSGRRGAGVHAPRFEALQDVSWSMVPPPRHVKTCTGRPACRRPLTASLRPRLQWVLLKRFKLFRRRDRRGDGRSPTPSAEPAWQPARADVPVR